MTDKEHNNPIPVAVGIMRVSTKDFSERFLAIRRGIEPAKGRLAFPGGYVDAGESAEQAVAREFVEECGLQTEASEWKLLTSRVTPDNRLLLFCLHDRFLPEDAFSRLVPSSEAHEFVAFGREETLGFALHQDVARLAFDGKLFDL